MLSLSEVRLRRGPQALVESASLTIHRGEKVGVVGRNGCGKSTLLALIRGEIAPDAGEYDAPPGLAIASVAQELPDTDATLLDHIRDGDLELISLERRIAAAGRDHAAGERLAALHAEYEHLDGYTARSRAARLAAGVGFAPEDLERSLRQLSGGLKMRANLARALMRRSDVLLLDEPTNHLDLDAVLWLESHLARYAGTLLLVSHDREFLDGVVGRIVHIEAGRLRAYAGNYSAFETQRAAQAERASALLAGRMRERERIESFVARFRAQATKARQVQSRLKWLSRLPAVVPAHVEESFAWEFPEPAKLPRPLVTLERAAAAYGARSVLREVSLAVSPGDRIGILGRNGAGKSTLMRLLAGQLAPAAGSIEQAGELSCGFFAQIELEHLDADATPFGELGRRGGPAIARWSELERRNHLGRFGFHGERVFEPTRSFSGGERARLALAILVARRPNLLLLDEPTNHLDLDMRHALLLALQEYSGAVVVVSHDRALLRGACDRFLLVAAGSVQGFDGDLEDYASWLARSEEAGSAGAAQEDSGPSRRERRRLEAEARNRLAPLRSERHELEERLERLGAERGALEGRLADPATYAAASTEEQRRLTARHGELSREIARLEERWLEVAETLERAC